MAMKDMKLEIWNGDWGLPSVDSNCLAVLAYCKFSGVPIDVVHTGNLWRSPSGRFPVLRHNDKALAKVPDIFNYMRQQHWGSDFELTTKQSADVVAFSAMLEDKLLPALLHLFWVDDKTYVDVIRPWYGSAMPFPLSLFLPWKIQKKADLRINVTKGRSCVPDEETELRIYKDAKECVNLLSYKLGTQDFMFGNKPSSLDALVFGHLAPLLKAPLPTNQLQNHLLQCDNLCKMCNNILDKYFFVEVKKQEEENRKNEREKSKTKPGIEYPNKKRNMVLAAVFVMTVMVGYAFHSGIIEMQILDD